ncbi:tRNA (adenosine(37)-N6)-threonylcarbamoyltransferase complex ATPase subunit type 1 TsaE [Candidatus Uhrbacteria bacterium]|nr:tRNA (adenosine(37)-N6)-threonylcarbamoyltransferase complex ATPase subunit type 1 TsaE [Candidatus Uhrbacteria bacterium]
MTNRTHRTYSDEETKTLAAEFARTLLGGEVIFLQGELGSGKTTFVRGAAQALGFHEPVRSPTFTIVQRYPVVHGAIRQLLHVDLYRLKDPSELTALALEEDLGQPDTVTFIEWPDVVTLPWKADATIQLKAISQTGRAISILLLPPRVKSHQPS